MTIIRSVSSSSSSIKRKPTTTKVSTASVKQIRQIQDCVDTNFGTLDSTKDGLVVAYDNVTGKFILVDSDSILVTSSEDANIPDQFITQLEQQLDLGTVSAGDIDGGTF